MWLYVINFVLIIYWWYLYTLIDRIALKRNPHNRKNLEFQQNIYKKENLAQKVLVFLPFLQVYLILALKSQSVGTDTISYLKGFHLIQNTSWNLIFNFQIENLVFNFERGFIFLTKSISLLTNDFTVYSAIIYMIMMLPLFIIIKKYSAIPFLSLILFISLGFLNFYFSGMRQSIAISLILLSYNFIVERKLLKFILLIAIASLIHQSAIFFIPAYFIVNMIFTPVFIILYFLVLLIVYILRYQLLGFVTHFIYSGVEIVNTGAYTLLLIVLMTFIAGLVTYKKTISVNSTNKILFNLIAIAAVLMVFNTVSTIGLRVANYYYIFMILFIPNLISSYKNNILKMFAITIVVAFTVTYYLQTGVNALNGTPYKFFWQ